MPDKVYMDEALELEGAWTLERAAELRQLLSVQLSRLAKQEPRPGQVEVGLAAVCDIDACGCQLLLVFLEDLRRRGIAAGSCGAGAQVQERIDLLGFRSALALPAPRQGDHDPGKEVA